jgi:SH3-like domain-containing protein
VVVVSRLGEGHWLVWRDGKKGSAQVGPKSDRAGPWDPEVNPIEAAEFRWWIQVKDAQGRTGWTDEPDHFINKDRCA